MAKALPTTLIARLSIAVLCCSMGLALTPPAWSAAADGVFVVTTTGDAGDALTVENCAAGTGECTLRAAILAANAHANLDGKPDIVVFAIEGAAPHVIAPTSALPVLGDPVTIDAGLPAAWAPRRVEVSGAQCNSTGNPCEGLVVGGSDTTIRGLALHEFFAGIRNVAGRGDGLVVEGNFIGTNAEGSAVVQRSFAPTNHGVFLTNVAGVRVGGDPAQGQGNVIAGHSSGEVEGVATPRVEVLGNYLGVLADGATTRSAPEGIRLQQASDSQLGTSAAPNVISGGASGLGIVLFNAAGTRVQGNKIGVNASGRVRTGNGGIDVQSEGVLIGGTGAGNVVSGGFGIHVGMNPATGAEGSSVVSHNYVGTDSTGTVAIPNVNGISMGDTGSVVEDNLIAGNSGNGLVIDTFAGPGHRISGNRIGVAADGTALGNGGFGVLVSDDFEGGAHVVGGTPEHGNTVAFNGQGGIAVGHRAEIPGLPLPQGVTIRYNSVHDNGTQDAPALGIDLPSRASLGAPDGIDDLDADTGSNDLQNAPEILSATTTSTSTLVTGRLRSAPGEQFDIDLYENRTCDETGYGEAEKFVATQAVATSGSSSSTPGMATFTFTVTPPVPVGHTLSATATNANASTSELSRCGTSSPGAQVSYTGPTTVTYSDPATLSGRLETVAEPPLPIAGRTLSLTLGSLSTVTAGPTSAAGTASAGPVTVTLKPGPTTATTEFVGDDIYNAATDSEPVTVEKEGCTLTYTGDTSATAGSTSTLRAQFGESDDNPGEWSGHLLDFAVSSASGTTTHHTTRTGNAGLASTTIQLPPDARSVNVSFAGDDYYLPCATSTDTMLTIQPANTVVTYTGPTTATYSDPVALGGRLEVAGVPAAPITGKSLSFTLGPMPTATAGPTAADGTAITTPIAVTAAPGQRSVITTFAGDTAYKEATDTDTVTVLREDCTLTYTGGLLVAPLTSTTLRAQFGESDTTPGDWAGHSLEFIVLDSTLTTTRYTAVTDAQGVASRTVALPANVYAVGVTFAGDELYNPCRTASDTVFTVEQAGAKVTGGGWVSTGIGRTSFGFNLIPQAGGAFTSQFQVRTSDKSTFHGSGPATATVLSANSVRWTGTGRWNGLTGYGYTVIVVDNGSSGAKKGDTITITIYRAGDPAHPAFSTGSQMLKGGNITVH
ncbi:hypothetical protein ACOCJ4_05685 [Knoellia sp. CPCC 206435]|uniref:hypothetical protein n=1 Tax=Knoellia terrae TaxID=3404797 RepID=UPI003B43CD8A